MEPLFKVEAYGHHIGIGQLLESGEYWWTWLTMQDALDFHYGLGNALDKVSNMVEGQHYAGRDLFTLEIGQAMEARNRVRSVEVGEVEA